MFPIIQNYAKNLLVLLQKKADRDELVNVKQTFGAYSMDVITSTSFGVNMDSINNPKDPFVQQVQKLLSADFFSPIFILLYVAPWIKPLLEKMNISVFSNESIDFFERSITKLKETRAQEGEKRRVDFLQLMIESQDSLTSHEMNGVNHTYKGNNLKSSSTVTSFKPEPAFIAKSASVGINKTMRARQTSISVKVRGKALRQFRNILKLVGLRETS
ncbi:PREDICTED: cytochrome P450 3A9-like [Thamnophis sirtalis]|uniref:Cytochrome P450 3A n=1 Tax=Thamnophis sirtalis TaxID=35019 RepID=A0A6I9YXU2_9SAUR|nr:PREDICTED: cytochrome P450 3A9-like [Thamnophis sirtalis]